MAGSQQGHNGRTWTWLTAQNEEGVAKPGAVFVALYLSHELIIVCVQKMMFNGKKKTNTKTPLGGAHFKWKFVFDYGQKKNLEYI